jgi:hypothetical protein
MSGSTRRSDGSDVQRSDVLVDLLGLAPLGREPPVAFASRYFPVNAPAARVADATMLAPLGFSASIAPGSSTGERRTRLHGSRHRDALGLGAVRRFGEVGGAS